MRRLTQNEFRLAALFAAAVFLALNLLGARAWMQHRANLVREISNVRASMEEGRIWVDGASALESARTWIEANPPPPFTGQDASTALLQSARSSAEGGGLKVLEENLLPEPTLPVGSAAALQMKLSGPFPAVARFLFAMQDPAAWRSIPKLTVRSEAEPPNVVVDMEIHQYYRPATPAVTDPGP